MQGVLYHAWLYLGNNAGRSGAAMRAGSTCSPPWMTANLRIT